MDRDFAIYLTSLIAHDYDKHHEKCISSYACEKIEEWLIKGDFEKIKDYIRW
jgi:hypothetical protein